MTVLTHTDSLHTLHGHVLLQLVLGDGLQAVERTLDVHMLAVALVWVQVSIQLTQCPQPSTPPPPHAALDLETIHLSLKFERLHGGEVLVSTFGTSFVLLLEVSYAGVAVALPTATGVGQPPSHQGTLLAVEDIKDSVYKLTLIA